MRCVERARVARRGVARSSSAASPACSTASAIAIEIRRRPQTSSSRCAFANDFWATRRDRQGMLATGMLDCPAKVRRPIAGAVNATAAGASWFRGEARPTERTRALKQWGQARHSDCFLPEPSPHAASELVVRSRAPGAVLGVARGDDRWIGAAGNEGLLGFTAMDPARTFRGQHHQTGTSRAQSAQAAPVREDT